MQHNRSEKDFEPIPFTISLLITLGIGIVAAMYTRPQIKGWYATLIKPDYTPPNWLFPVAWTTLYILIAIAAYMVWKRRDDSTTYKTAAVIYIIQLVLNFSWSIVFFGCHQIFGGLVVIVTLLVVIVLNIWWFGRVNYLAALLMVPYFIWVAFATLLNIGIDVLNK